MTPANKSGLVSVMPSENENNDESPNGGRYYRVEYWSDDSPGHPVGSQFIWHHTIEGARSASLNHMGEVCFPRGLGVDYHYVNVIPAAYVPDDDDYVTDASNND